MAQGPYKSVNLPDVLVDQVDAFVRSNTRGYRSRAEVSAEAIRRFLRRESGDEIEFREELYVELLFLLQHTLDTTDPKRDAIQRLQEGLFAWRRYRLGYDTPADAPAAEDDHRPAPQGRGSP